MPVTAKLSRRVYETLGDDVANAIVEWFNAVDSTYKADLRELNDLNFARFEAKMDARFAKIDARFAGVDARFGQTDAKIEAAVAQLTARIDNCVNRVTFEHRLAELEVGLTKRMYGIAAGSVLTQILALIAILKFMTGH